MIVLVFLIGIVIGWSARPAWVLWRADSRLAKAEKRLHDRFGGGYQPVAPPNYDPRNAPPPPDE